MTSIFDKVLSFGRGQNFPPAVLVTGPQRSGTRIAAKMCAADLGYEYVDERAIDIANLATAIEVFERGGTVLHAPGLCAESHLLWDPRLLKVATAVIVVRRHLDDIITSCKRINWNAKGEIRKYRSRPEFAPYLTAGAHIAQWKYEVLHGYQWPIVNLITKDSPFSFYYQIDYEDLSAHPLWFPKEERIDWEWDRTAPGIGGRSE